MDPITASVLRDAYGDERGSYGYAAICAVVWLLHGDGLLEHEEATDG